MSYSDDNPKFDRMHRTRAQGEYMDRVAFETDRLKWETFRARELLQANPGMSRDAALSQASIDYCAHTRNVPSETTTVKPTPLEQRRTTLKQIIARIVAGKPVSENEIEAAMAELERAAVDEYKDEQMLLADRDHL
jgi:hypothetical protein